MVLAGVKSDINRHEDALEECAQYRIFLNALTPPEWLQVFHSAAAPRPPPLLSSSCANMCMWNAALVSTLRYIPSQPPYGL